MPELPEVETVRRQLEAVLVGQKIKSIKCLRKKSLQGSSLKVCGKKIVGVGRRAKLVVVTLNSKHYLLIHLKMTGQLVYVPNIRGYEPRIFGGHPSSDWVNKLPSKHTRVVIELDRGTLFFNDMRVFGWVKIVNEEEKDLEMIKYGPDVNSRKFNFKYLKQALKS